MSLLKNQTVYLEVQFVTVFFVCAWHTFTQMPLLKKQSVYLGIQFVIVFFICTWHTFTHMALLKKKNSLCIWGSICYSFWHMLDTHSLTWPVYLGVLICYCVIGTYWKQIVEKPYCHSCQFFWGSIWYCPFGTYWTHIAAKCTLFL